MRILTILLIALIAQAKPLTAPIPPPPEAQPRQEKSLEDELKDTIHFICYTIKDQPQPNLRHVPNCVAFITECVKNNSGDKTMSQYETAHDILSGDDEYRIRICGK